MQKARTRRALGVSDLSYVELMIWKLVVIACLAFIAGLMGWLRPK
jgi:hypothetical protein